MSEKLILMHENTPYFKIFPFLKPLGGAVAPPAPPVAPPLNGSTAHMTPAFVYYLDVDVPVQGFVGQISFALNYVDFFLAFKIDSSCTTNSYTQVSLG